MNIANNRVALVTGGARRIGAEIVRQLHNAGFCVIIHAYKSANEAKELALSLNTLRTSSATVLIANLTDEALLPKLVQDSFHWHGRLDLIVNNASIFAKDFNMWDKLFQINLKAPYILSQASKPYLDQTHGCIINITDIHAEQPLKDYTIYCQTKAALLMQTKALAREFAPNIRVNAVAPGAISWPEKENSLSIDLKNKIIDKTLLKRHGAPEFIALAVLALVENTFITGQTLKVDGGRSITS